MKADRDQAGSVGWAAAGRTVTWAGLSAVGKLKEDMLTVCVCVRVLCETHDMEPLQLPLNSVRILPPL